MAWLKFYLIPSSDKINTETGNQFPGTIFLPISVFLKKAVVIKIRQNKLKLNTVSNTA